MLSWRGVEKNKKKKRSALSRWCFQCIDSKHPLPIQPLSRSLCGRALQSFSGYLHSFSSRALPCSTWGHKWVDQVQSVISTYYPQHYLHRYGMHLWRLSLSLANSFSTLSAHALHPLFTLFPAVLSLSTYHGSVTALQPIFVYVRGYFIGF